MAVRVRAWLVVCAALLIVLVPVALASTMLLGLEHGTSRAFAAESLEDGATPLTQNTGVLAPDETGASVPVQPVRLARQAYELLLDNFVSPPAPARLLVAAAAEVGQRAAEHQPGEWPAPTIADNASRDDAWAAFEVWLERVAGLLAPDVDRAAVDEIAVRALATAMAEHHTRYLDPRQHDEYQAWRRGEARYEGIGARLRRPSTVVLEVFDDSPAEQAGLRTGDRIVSVDGESVDGATSEQAIERIRGAPGTTVKLVVERRGIPEPLTFSLRRAEIRIQPVRSEILRRADGRKIGYLQIRGFPEPSVDERVRQALAEIDRYGVDGFVLDLRGNAGGRIDVGMKVVSRFVKDGVAFQQTDRSGRERRVRPSGGQYWERSIPMVTLVDGGSASMAEILASALQESGASRIVGMRTAGSVAGARLFPLGNGGALLITVLTITSGRGVVLNDAGVTPDVAVDLSDDDLLGGIDAQLEAGIRSLTPLVEQPRGANVIPFLLPRARVLAEAA